MWVCMLDDKDNALHKPTKSQLKREAQASLDLAKALVELDASSLETLPLPQPVYHAVLETKRIRSHVARKRQLHYLAKQLRKIDEEPIRDRLQHFQQQHAAATHQFHAIERWRDRLIDEGDATLEAFINAHPDADRQRLRQYVRNARQEAANNKPPRAARTLFQYLRELLVDSGGVGPADGQ